MIVCAFSVAGASNADPTRANSVNTCFRMAQTPLERKKPCLYLEGHSSFIRSVRATTGHSSQNSQIPRTFLIRLSSVLRVRLRAYLELPNLKRQEKNRKS